MGLYLLVYGLATASGAFFAPTYDPVTAVMAGCVALSGALVLVKMALERSVFQRRISFIHRGSE
jgi:hypothetical protein